MPLTPVISGSGLAAWNFLKATEDNQITAFNRSPDIERDVQYFRENITEINSLDEFMSDRRLLKVALGAFGLGEEINKGAFVRKVLEEGTLDQSAFAVRLNNPDYLDMAEKLPVFDGLMSVSSNTAEEIISDYRVREYEVAVGEVDNDMRLALNFRREMSELASSDLTESAGWFKVMASVPMRTVLEGAFNLPSSFSQLDIDRQREILSDKAQSLYGESSVEVFQDTDKMESAIQRFLLRQQIEQGPSANTPGFAALSILSGGIGSVGIANLLLSNS